LPLFRREINLRRPIVNDEKGRYPELKRTAIERKASMRRCFVLILLLCSTWVFAEGAANNGLFFGIQGLAPNILLGQIGYCNRVQEGKVLRFGASFGFTYDFFDNASVSQPNNYRFNAGLSADMIFVMTKTVINP
jgi:hypothetical protein